MKWMPIDTAPKDTMKMFVVCAFNVDVGTGNSYATDPVTTWATDGEFPRWKHDFPPTHWVELPKFSG